MKKIISAIVLSVGMVLGLLATATPAAAGTETHCAVPTPIGWTHGCWNHDFLKISGKRSAYGTRMVLKMWTVPAERTTANKRQTYGVQLISEYDGRLVRITNHAIRVLVPRGGEVWKKADSLGRTQTSLYDSRHYYLPDPLSVEYLFSICYELVRYPNGRFCDHKSFTATWYYGEPNPTVYA